MSSSVPPQLDASGQFLTTGYDWGTPLDYFDMQIALAAGMSESTRLKQLAKALVFWTSVQSNPAIDSNTLLKANFAVSFLTAELARVQNPPPNNLHVTYPV